MKNLLAGPCPRTRTSGDRRKSVTPPPRAIDANGKAIQLSYRIADIAAPFHTQRLAQISGLATAEVISPKFGIGCLPDSVYRLRRENSDSSQMLRAWHRVANSKNHSSSIAKSSKMSSRR